MPLCTFFLFLLTTPLYILAKPELEDTLGPHLEDQHTTTCEEFSRTARFNPNSVLNDKWVVFYYWAPNTRNLIYSFNYPHKTYRDKLQKYLDPRVNYPVNWTAPLFVMKEHHSNDSVLIVQRGDRGMFALYPIIKIRKEERIHVRDICFKQTGDNKYIAFMFCTKQTAYLMSRLFEIPKKKIIQEEAARIGFRGRGGKSYLYQGHSWMPIPEADEESFYPNVLRNKLQENKKECSVKTKLNDMIHSDESGEKLIIRNENECPQVGS